MTLEYNTPTHTHTYKNQVITILYDTMLQYYIVKNLLLSENVIRLHEFTVNCFNFVLLRFGLKAHRRTFNNQLKLIYILNSKFDSTIARLYGLTNFPQIEQAV